METNNSAYTCRRTRTVVNVNANSDTVGAEKMRRMLERERSKKERKPNRKESQKSDPIPKSAENNRDKKL